MNITNKYKLIILMFCAFNFAASAEEVGSAFSYQGSLLDNGSPANGLYDISFKAYYQLEGGMALAIEPTFLDVSVESGLFTIPQVDFGEAVFAESAVFIEALVRKSSEGGDYSTLEPRQRIGVAPFAIAAKYANLAEHADSASSADTADLADVATTANALAPIGANASDFLQFNGVSWQPATLPVMTPSPWNISNSDLYYNTGDVGIGLAAPDTRLHIHSNDHLELSRFDGGNQMYNSFYENGQPRGYIGSYQNGNYIGTATEDFEIGTSSTNNAGKFHLTTQSDPRLTIDNLGQIGIGTTEPTARLDVEGFEFLDPLNVSVSGNSKLQVKNNGNVQTDGNLITNGTVVMNNNSQQAAQNNGQLKYMVVAECDTNTATIIRSYNGTTTAGSVSTSFIVNNQCRINFPTDIENRYWVASANTSLGGVNASCMLFDSDTLTCNVGYISDGNNVNLGGTYTVLVY